MYKDSEILNDALEHYQGILSAGFTDRHFEAFLQDKCNDPRSVYLTVLQMYKDKKFPKDRNQPFRVEKNLPPHMFAKKMCKKILGSSRLF